MVRCRVLLKGMKASRWDGSTVMAWSGHVLGTCRSGFRYGNGKIGADVKEACDPRLRVEKGSAMVQDKWHARSDACGCPEPNDGMNGDVPNSPKRCTKARARMCGRGVLSQRCFKGSGGSEGTGSLEMPMNSVLPS